MLVEVILDKLTGHGNEGKVVKVHVKPGDEVKERDIILEVESNKGNVEVEAGVEGIVNSVNTEEGEVVKIGDVLASIESQQSANEAREQNNEDAVGFDYFGGLLKPQKRTLESDITIIGGGPGGYVAAIYAAKLGAKVVLVEKEKLGGTCLNRGCIPTKALVQSAKVYKNIKNATSYGIHTEDFSVDMEKVIGRKDDIVTQLVNGIEYLLSKNGVELLKGEGKIQDNETVFVNEGMKETTIKSKNIIIATGSDSCTIPIYDMGMKNVVTSREALDMKELPKSIAIIGGGVIGMEFAFIYAHLGVEVTVIEFLDNVLATFDDDVIEEISQAAKDDGIKLYTGSRVEKIVESENGQCILSFKKDDEIKYITSDKVLIAVGRKPCFDGLDLEELGIELDDSKRGIKVNDKMQTSIPNIYAIGDVTNKVQLAHVASHQGIVAVKNIMGKEAEMEYDSVPSAVFTEPEIATVGIGEKAAREKGMDITVGKFPFAANGKALTLGESRGFVKLIKDNSSGTIIGGTIIGPNATELIAEITLAVKNNLTMDQIVETIHAHPTTPEAVHEAALAAGIGSIHFAE